MFEYLNQVTATTDSDDLILELYDDSEHGKPAAEVDMQHDHASSNLRKAEVIDQAEAP